MLFSKKLASTIKITLLSVLFSTLSFTSAHAARFFLEPENANLSGSCDVTVRIMLDTQGQEAQGADAIIQYNPSEIEIVDQNPGMAGVQIRTGNIFNVYAGNKAENGKIYLTAFNMFDPYKTTSGPGVYGVIVLKNKSGVSSANLNFDFTNGNTKDSNVAAVDSTDILTSVGNGSYTFTEKGFCGDDLTPPVISNISPAPQSKNNPLNANITFDVSDVVSGVARNSIVLTVDGEEFRDGETGVEITGDRTKYSVTINPKANFLPDTPVIVAIDAVDLEGNRMQTYRYSFNHPIIDNDPPYITGLNPGAGSSNIPLDANITFHARDNLKGVDINSIRVNINGTDYFPGDANFVYSGTEQDYFIVIDPDSNFPEEAPVEVTIYAKDLSGNEMAPYNYSFNHPLEDRTPPQIRDLNPVAGDRKVPLESDISFHILDNIGGVNITSVEVDINGHTYTRRDGEFSFSGSENDYEIVINPREDFPEDTEITVEINAKDLRGNIMEPFTYQFNRPSVCGDLKVEEDFGEQCEPPNTSACGEDCILLDYVEGDPECGNGIIEEGEECEMPGTSCCNEECLFPRDNCGIGETATICHRAESGLEKNMTVSWEDLLDHFAHGDYCGSCRATSEIMPIENQTEVNVCVEDPEYVWEGKIKIVNLKDGDVIGTKKLLVKGISHPEENVKIFAKPIESVIEGRKIFVGESKAATDSKFLVFADTNLDAGEYELIAESYDDDNQLIDTSESVHITIDYTKLGKDEWQLSCGNTTVEIWEECEPPNVGTCGSDCLLTDIEQIESEVGDFHESARCEVEIQWADKTVITNLQDGDIIGMPDLLVQGLTHPQASLKLFAQPIEGFPVLLEEGQGSDENEFEIQTSLDLSTGEYSIYVESYDETGEKIDQSEAIQVIVDFSKPTTRGGEKTCGNNKVEIWEACEPPNAGSCTEKCVLAEPTIEKVEPVDQAPECGNNRVEAGEACEPPNVGFCSSDCSIKPVRDLGDIRRDSDGDGIPDSVKAYYGLDPDTMEVDENGVTALERILDYGMTPGNMGEIDYSTRIVNWEYDSVTGSKNIFVKGVSYAGENVKIYATNEDEEKIFLGEMIADDKNKFAVYSEEELAEGEYMITAQSYDKNNQLHDESEPIKIVVDYKKNIDAPFIETIDDQPIIEGLKVEIHNGLPVVSGFTKPNSQVFAIFQSSIMSSTVFADDLSGFFVIVAPKTMELGDHTVTVYAISNEGVTSSPARAKFQIIEVIETFKGLNWWLLALVIILLLLIALDQVRWRKKRQEAAYAVQVQNEMERTQAVEKRQIHESIGIAPNPNPNTNAGVPINMRPVVPTSTPEANASSNQSSPNETEPTSDAGDKNLKPGESIDLDETPLDNKKS